MTMGLTRFASGHVPSHDGQLPFALVGLFLSHLLKYALCELASRQVHDDPFHNVDLFHTITICLLSSKLPLSNDFASRHVRTHQFVQT